MKLRTSIDIGIRRLFSADTMTGQPDEVEVGRERRMGRSSGMEPRHVSLDDKYALEKGSAYMSGVQVLVRLPLLQRARDEANGLRTGGFISGYRGSPLGGYDHALWGAQKWLVAKGIHFEPGLNEDSPRPLSGSQH